MVSAGRPLAPDLGVCVVPAVLDSAHPPVLDREPHQTERHRRDCYYTGGHALALVAGAESRQRPYDGDHARHDEQITRPADNVDH